MPINYNTGRQPRPAYPGTPQAPAVGRFALSRQAPLSRNAQLADDQNLEGLQTGRFADVESARGATDRANAMRSSSSLQAARGTVARSGEMSPEAAIRAQDQAFSSAEAQNLNASNGVNQLQRQYRTDALNRSADIESRDQTNANNERAYQTNRDDERYSRFGLERANTQQQAQQGVANTQWDKSFGANREDAATQRNQFGENLAQRQQEFGVTSGQSQQQINNQAGQFRESMGQRDKEFGVSAGQNQQQINNQVDQFGRSLDDSRGRFDLSRADSNSQFDKTFGANREDAATAKDEWGQTFGANRQDAATQRDQFGQTFGANREDAATAKNQFNQNFNANRQDRTQDVLYRNNQADESQREFNANYGANREDAADSRGRFDLSRADANSQFNQNFGANRDDAANAQGNFDKTFGASRDDAAYDRSYQAGRDQLGDTRYDQTYQDQRGDINYNRGEATRLEGKGDELAAINSIQDPKAKQAAYNAYMNGEDVSKFITGTLYGNKGDLNKDYASASPAAQEAEANVEKLKTVTPRNPGETDDQFDGRVRQLAADKNARDYSVSEGVAQDAAMDRSVSSKMSSGADLSADEKAYAVRKGLVNKFAAKDVPRGDAANKLKGQQVNIDGGVYTVVGGSSFISGSGGPFSGFGDTHTDYTILDRGGQKVYMLPDGKIVDQEPQDKN